GYVSCAYNSSKRHISKVQLEVKLQNSISARKRYKYMAVCKNRLDCGWFCVSCYCVCVHVCVCALSALKYKFESVKRRLVCLCLCVCVCVCVGDRERVVAGECVDV